MRSPQNYIIFPLDVATAEEAVAYAERLAGAVGMFKVGLELFIAAGPEIVRRIQAASDAEIFLDLKLHDIPATVERAMARAADLGVKFVTVHCGENPRMLAAAVKGGGGRVGVLGVTVLTSVSSEDIRRSGFREEYAADMARLVKQRAETAKAAGCVGVVCSGREVKPLKAACGSDFLAVTPGIRPAWGLTQDDQRRIVTPAAAVRDGADYLVIGRPIRDAADPKAAAEKIAGEIGTAIAALKK